jgi:multidrug efflux pump subunit AcrA (membrane-fusion protein)
MSPETSTLDELRIDRSAPAKQRSVAWIGGLVFVLILAGAFLWWRFTRTTGPEVRTVTVQETGAGGQKILLNASGYVTARRAATVSSKVTGKVIEVLIEEGLKVKEGQILARLDSSNVEASLRLTEAQLEAAKSGLHGSGSAWRKQSENIEDHGPREERDRRPTSIKQARLNRSKRALTCKQWNFVANGKSLWQQQMDDDHSSALRIVVSECQPK